VVIAVFAMRAVEVVSNQVVDMAVVWHRFVPASGAVLVVFAVPATRVLRSARDGIVSGVDGALVDVALVAVMQVTVVQVVDVAVVANGSMPAARTVRVTMPLVLRVIHFCLSLNLAEDRPSSRATAAPTARSGGSTRAACSMESAHCPAV
jgi:hypothetical protein